MEKRKCKNTDLELSILGTGCWSFGGGDYWGSQDQKDVTNVVHESVNLGINYFDTAEAYNEGRSELALGDAIKGIPRDKLILGTKISPSNCYNKTIIAHCEQSLKRLGTDYVDIYMVHWPIHPHSIKHFTDNPSILKNPPNINDTIESLRQLKKSGKIREFGISNFAKSRMEDLPLEEIAVNQLPYNLLCRAIEFDTLPYCEMKGVGIIGYMALLQGILADKYATLNEVKPWQRRTRHFNALGSEHCRHGETGAEEETNSALNAIRYLCKETELTMTDIAINWIIQNPGITCTLVGSRNIQQLNSNVQSLNKKLPLDVKEELDRITAPLMNKLGNHFDYYESASNDRTI
ncbi:aldo/keto reductase [Arenibacter sp. TNZ]|uniref:aldo/keto reductase n=1 Tax=Arenibacter TaxID=178469 RepID=UPI000CD44117|nr:MULTISPECIES: aldo/keto reductase [Arenibacter]MCM4170874.1 aldo/keto reductase [Arenibacter sp. TNZ]